jgi:predicted anti-sigma-YlaC factor YlaD
MFKHYKIKKLISVYIDGEVSEEEKKFIENHLKVCSSCRKYLEDLKRINSFLKTWEDESISPDLEQKIKMNFLNNKNKEVRKMKSKKILIGSTGILVVLLLTLIGINMFVNIEDKQKTSDLILTKYLPQIPFLRRNCKIPMVG